MTATLSTILLWLFVIDLGIAFGAGLYEHRIVVSRWINQSPDSMWHWNADAARLDDSGRRFWGFVTTGPLTLLTIASVIAAWSAPDPVRSWWLWAASIALVDRLFTFFYFIPTMVRLMRAVDSAASVATARRWTTLNYLRHAIILIAWLTALKTFSLIAAL